jgi:hypothetical protein
MQLAQPDALNLKKQETGRRFYHFGKSLLNFHLEVLEIT